MSVNQSFCRFCLVLPLTLILIGEQRKDPKSLTFEAIAKIIWLTSEHGQHSMHERVGEANFYAAGPAAVAVAVYKVVSMGH